MIPVLTFVLGVAVLVYCAEKLIGQLVGVASRWAISLFLVALVFTGVEVDDLALGLALGLEDLHEVALGTVIGTTIAMPGLVLAVAAAVAPTSVAVPRDYLALYAGAPVVMYALALTGRLTALTGVVLLVLFAAFVAWIGLREYAARRPVWRDAALYEQIDRVTLGGGIASRRGRPEPAGPAGAPPPGVRVDAGFLRARRRSPATAVALAVLALAGLVVGAAVAGAGTEGILEEFALPGTVFGVTVATLALSLEDLLLTVEPARRGAPEIGVANVVGSVVFSVTGKLGILLLAGGTMVVTDEVVRWHLPVLVLLTATSAVFLASGRLRRRHGVVLLAAYVAYVVVSLVSFGGVPVGD
ncbi:sodium/calcium exchanger protein [Actinomycetospora straminea]|uniref:Sodium/hydrogen exchanger n=1 Tax=Actinomycetospora straminea TaxID=663607 RepID=A0ABP9F5Q3_9PSEU|nr:sodium/calcium exchanger protein [Actinomycetospora straminea]MDD7931641.1 sodium/calcium exchanger protein [Actinomycetospora straminea]